MHCPGMNSNLRFRSCSYPCVLCDKTAAALARADDDMNIRQVLDTCSSYRSVNLFFGLWWAKDVRAL